MEFNVSLPGGANASVAPVSTLTKVIDVIIPNGVSIINQQILDELPTSLPVKGHCAYSVFDVRITPAPSN